MADIIDTEELDRDTVEEGELAQLFSCKYNLIAEKAVSLKNSFINKISCTKRVFNNAKESLPLKIGVSLSDNSIEVYELNNTSLTRVCKLSGHKETLTELVFGPKEDHIIYSAAQDGLVKLWDTRKSGTCVQEYKDPEETVKRPYNCMDISHNGRVICAGSDLVQDDAYLVFFDQRFTKPLGGYFNSHTDDITQVKFHPTKAETLATGAVDGLLNIFNIAEQTEDDALLYSLNVENSVEKLNWLDEKNISCITQSSDLQLWDTESGDMVKNINRDKVSRSIKRSKADDCYLVDAYTCRDVTALLAGSSAGNVLRSVSLDNNKLQPMTDFAQNKQIVRCCHYDSDRDFLITAGESGLISIWSGEAISPDNGKTSSKITNSRNNLYVKRCKPY